MAVIGAIRRRTGLVIGVIAVALLMFLLMDALSSSSRTGGGSGQNVGKINGTKVDYVKYQKSLGNYEERITTLFPNAQIDATNRAQFRDEVWNNFASQAILGRNMEQMGLSVTADELGSAMWGENVHFFAQNVLVNPQTGQFDRNYARQVVIQAEQAAPDDPNKIRIGHLENLIEEDRMKTKYSSLFTKGIYVPDFMAKDEKANSLKSANVSYILYPYSEIADADISYTDKDLEKYISGNAAKFKQDESRELKYYTINIIPSVEDSANALTGIQKILDEYKTTDDDSLFVRRYSDAPYTGRYFTVEELAGDPNTDAYFADDIGTFYDPYFHNGSYIVSKLKDRKLIPDSVSARHMLLVPTTFEQVDSLRALADSLVDLVKSRKASFETLAPIHSKDESNKGKGGDLGYFGQGVMVPTFNDAVFYKYEQGDVFTVDSRFGIHIIKIDKAVPAIPAVKVAAISQLLDYSKDTERELFREANKFRTDHNTPEKFKAAEGEYFINTVSVTKNQVAIPGIDDARNLVQWAFKEKIGTVNYFDIQDKYIVALLSGEREEGTGSLDQLRTQVEQEVKNQKKAAVVADKVKAAGSGNIQELASATGKEVKSLPALNSSASSLEGSGNESDVVGYIFGMNDGEMSGVLEGSSGIYVIQLNSMTDPGVTDANFFAEKARLKPNLTFQSLLEELKEDANIDDSRYLYY